MKDFLFISSVCSAWPRLWLPAEPRKRWRIACLRPLLPGPVAEPLRASNRPKRDLLLNIERPLFILHASKLTNYTNKPILDTSQVHIAVPSCAVIITVFLTLNLIGIAPAEPKNTSNCPHMAGRHLIADSNDRIMAMSLMFHTPPQVLSGVYCGKGLWKARTADRVVKAIGRPKDKLCPYCWTGECPKAACRKPAIDIVETKEPAARKTAEKNVAEAH